MKEWRMMDGVAKKASLNRNMNKSRARYMIIGAEHIPDG